MSTTDTMTPQERQKLRARVHAGAGVPALTAGARWKEWMHPRGLNGRFIEKFSMVDVFPNQDGSGESYRARVVKLRPEGMKVDYYDPHGQKIASPGADYPEFIPSAEISKRVSSAPKGTGARLDLKAAPAAPDAPDAPSVPDKPKDKRPEGEKLDDPTGSVAEFMQSTDMQGWREKVAGFNRTVDTSHSQNSRGEKLSPMEQKDWDAIDAPLGPDGVDGIFNRVNATLDPRFKDHQDFVAQTVRDAESSGLNIESMFQDKEGNWTPAVRKYADSLVNRLIARDERDGIPKDRKALVLGGLPGAGKSTIIGKLGLNDDRNPKWVSLNPDLIKEEMIADGVFPQVSGLAPMETVGMIHELSSDISKQYTKAAMMEGFNVIHDVTLGTEKAAKRIAENNDINGYTADAVFVDVPVEWSAKSQIKRHLGGMNKLRAGTDPNGGRYVPTGVLGSAVPTKDGYNSKNAEIFDWAKNSGMFRRWAMVDNNHYAGVPLAVGSGSQQLTGDPAALINATGTMPGLF